MSWATCSVSALQERELHTESLSLRQVLRQGYLELAEKRLRFSFDRIVTKPRKPSNRVNLGGDPLLGIHNLALCPLQIGK